MESYNDYKTFCIDKLQELSNELPDYTVGQLFQSIKHYLRTEFDKSFFEVTDSEMYRAICITIQKEKDEERGN